jgi:hypothetical protein
MSGRRAKDDSCILLIQTQPLRPIQVFILLMGETICRIKTGNESRLVKDEVYSILGVSSRVSRRILAREEKRGDNDELEGGEAIDQPAYEPGYDYEDYDDGVS